MQLLSSNLNREFGKIMHALVACFFIAFLMDIKYRYPLAKPAGGRFLRVFYILFQGCARENKIETVSAYGAEMEAI